MNHWFLVGRDIMWFALAWYPLLVFLHIPFQERWPSEFSYSFAVVTAVIVQFGGIALLYFQVIK